MKLEAATWPEGTTVQEWEEDAEAFDLVSDMNRFSAPVHVHLTVHKHLDEVIIEGRLATKVEAVCVRCLDEFAIPLAESFRRIAHVVPDRGVGEDSGDPDFVFLPASLPVWDLNEVLREVVLLAAPENPLCRNNCAGLCSGCGASLNRERCRCTTAHAPGPFAELTEILSRRRQEH